MAFGKKADKRMLVTSRANVALWPALRNTMRCGF